MVSVPTAAKQPSTADALMGEHSVLKWQGWTEIQLSWQSFWNLLSKKSLDLTASPPRHHRKYYCSRYCLVQHSNLWETEPSLPRPLTKVLLFPKVPSWIFYFFPIIMAFLIYTSKFQLYAYIFRAGNSTQNPTIPGKASTTELYP